MVKKILFSISVSTLLYSAPNLNSLDDFKLYPQEINPYTCNITESKTSLVDKNIYSSYYSPWRNKLLVKKNSIEWMRTTYSYKKGYSENMSKYDKQEFTSIINNANFNEYGKNLKKGITLSSLNVRSLPTEKPYTASPDRAGEGLPFDYFQNSGIMPNTPIQIANKSVDGEWVFIISKSIYGWVKERDIAYINDTKIKNIKNLKQGFVIKDNIVLKDSKKLFLSKARIGMILPILRENSNYYTVLVASSDSNHNALLKESKIEKKYISDKPLKFNKKNAEMILSELLGINYGWGGLYQNRDCSSTLQDYFLTFGKLLPRNSKQQSNAGKKINLSKKKTSEKIELIKKYGKPFRTLLHKRGHIVLYLGTYKDKIMIFHNMWGVKYYDENSIEQREVVGGSVISSLFLGDEIQGDKKAPLLIDSIDTITIL